MFVVYFHDKNFNNFDYYTMEKFIFQNLSIYCIVLNGKASCFDKAPPKPA